MKSGAMRWFIVVAALLVLPTTGYAQEADDHRPGDGLDGRCAARRYSHGRT